MLNSPRLDTSDQVWHESCPACGSDDSVHFRNSQYSGVAVHHRRCVRCSLVFMNPRPTQAWYDHFFALHYWEGKADKWSVDAHANVRQWRKQLSRAERYITFLKEQDVAPPAETYLLDIGCAYGLIARTLADRFDNIACGIEPSHVARNFASRELGLQIISETSMGLESWKPEFPVGLVLFSHVLEYIADPNAVLSSIRNLISPDGLLLIETPNIYLMRAAHIHHPYCYSKRSLASLFQRHGFSLLAVEPSGMLKSPLSSGFFTAIARVIPDRQLKTSPQKVNRTPYAGIGMDIGQVWFRCANRFPLNRLGGLLNGYQRHLTNDSQQRLDELVARISK